MKRGTPFYKEIVRELIAVYYDSAAFLQIDQPAVYIIGHSSLFYQNKLQILVPVADGRTVWIGGKESVYVI